MHVLGLLLVLGFVMAGSAVEEALASVRTESHSRRLSDAGRSEFGPKFPASSVGFFLDQRAQKQQRKGEKAGHHQPNPDVLEDVLKRLRGISEQTPDVSDQSNGSEQPNGSEERQ